MAAWRLILVYCLLDGPRRFADLQKEVGIARRMLAVNLTVGEYTPGVISRECRG